MGIQPSILKAFDELGRFLSGFVSQSGSGNDKWSIQLNEAIATARNHNAWFTRDNILFALGQWGGLLTEKKLIDWFSIYDINANNDEKTVAIIMAGNIPLVGFHDFICALLTGHRLIAKPSSNDKILLPFIADYLMAKDTSLKSRIRFTNDRLDGFDAVIATGSNNTGRYFEHYFGQHPNIIRKNRNSVGVLTGQETKEELENLGKDIFTYFGLGCRSLSKVFVPNDYDFHSFFEAIYSFKDIINNHKYANNYDYNKAVYLMSDFKILDNNFLLLKQDDANASPIGTLFYETYDTLDTVTNKLDEAKEQLQCVVSNGVVPNSIAFGQTQQPKLTDYADNIDTVRFLLSLNRQ